DRKLAVGLCDDRAWRGRALYRPRDCVWCLVVRPSGLVHAPVWRSRRAWRLFHHLCRLSAGLLDHGVDHYAKNETAGSDRLYHARGAGTRRERPMMRDYSTPVCYEAETLSIPTWCSIK